MGGDVLAGIVPPELVVWDWREQPEWDEIVDAQRRGLFYIRPVPQTGSDSYAVVMSAAPMPEAAAQAVFDQAVQDGMG